jgi:hypothetical protein
VVQRRLAVQGQAQEPGRLPDWSGYANSVPVVPQRMRWIAPGSVAGQALREPLLVTAQVTARRLLHRQSWALLHLWYLREWPSRSWRAEGST